MDPFNKIGYKENFTLMNKGRYESLVRKLIYLSHTRLVISFVASVISQLVNNPTEEHVEAFKRILRYLKMTLEKAYSSRRGLIEILKFSKCILAWISK